MSSSQTISVSIFNRLVDAHLREIGPLIVEGEISQLQVSQGKWLFMTIKDDRASVGVFGAAFKLSGLDLLEEGMKVHVYGTPGLYQRSGRFNLNAIKIVPAGEGALRLAYEKLKAKLEMEGLFEPARKRKLPRFPQKIGLITAQGSRAYGDFIKVLAERMGGLEIHFYPVNVQGEQAVSSLMQAFAYFNQQDDFDAIVMTRGGGSLEDLLSFNDEQVARAVFGSKFPVVSGIGHEDDVALTDFVADVRASTPSNAAELLVRSRQQVQAEVNQLEMKLERSLEQMLREWRQSIEYSVRSLENFFGKQKEAFVTLTYKLKQHVFLGAEKVSQWEDKRQDMVQRLLILSQRNVDLKKKDLENLDRLLHSLDYRQVLKRGFTMTKDANGKVISSISQVQSHMKLVTHFADGQAYSQIDEIESHKGA